MATDLERISDHYERAERVFLDAVRGAEERPSLARAAREAAIAAGAFNAESYRKLLSGDDDAWIPLGDLTERTEVLSELWADIASAYEA